MRRLVTAALGQAARLAGTALAVALAVGLVSGTSMLTDTVGSAFHRASASATTTSDVVVRAATGVAAQASGVTGGEPLPASLVATVNAVPGIRSLWTAVQGYAAMVDKEGEIIAPDGLPTVGASWAPGDTLNAGQPPRAGGVVVDLATARRYHLRLGDKIRILFAGSSEDFTIAGLLRRTADLVGTAATTAIFNQDTAQRVLGHQGQIDEISVQATPGTSPAALQARINAVLPSSYEAVTTAQVAEEAAQSWAKSLGFLPSALLLLAGVALVVGALLIWNTFSILVAQRTRDLGLLRALGASRAQLGRLVLAEAVAVGLCASAAGLVIGFGAAHALLALARGTGVTVPTTSVVFRVRSAGTGIICGVTLTIVAAFLPARRATRVSPVTALKVDEAAAPGSLRRRGGPAAAATLSAVASLTAGTLHLVPTLPATALGVAAILVALALLLPALAGLAAWAIGAPLIGLFGQPAALARQNVMRNPRRSAATAAALMIGIGLVGVIAIVSASMKASATAAVQRTLRADLVVVPTGSSAAVVGVPPVVADQLRHTPGVGLVSEVGGGQWELAGAAETLLAVDPATVTRMHEVDAASAAAVGRLDDTGVLVRDTVAEHHGWKVGDVVPMTFARTGTRGLAIQGIFSTTAVRADYVISLKAFAANYAQPLLLEMDVKLAGGISPATAQANVRRAMADLPVVKVMDRSQVLSSQQAQVDKLLTPLAAMLGLSVLIGLLGIANALALSINQRTSEIGLLRAVGMARSQLRTMIRCEAVIIAGIGSVLGLGLAVGLGWVLVGALRHLGLTTLTFPVGQLGILAAVATGAGVVAAILPARRAAGLAVLDAVHHGS